MLTVVVREPKAMRISQAANKTENARYESTIIIEVRTCSCDRKKQCSICPTSMTGPRSILDQLAINPPFTLPPKLNPR